MHPRSSHNNLYYIHTGREPLDLKVVKYGLTHFQSRSICSSQNTKILAKQLRREYCDQSPYTMSLRYFL